MELSKQEYKNIENLINNKTNEFEVRLNGEHFESNPILHHDFMNIVNYLIYSKEKNGLGLDYKLSTSLDIQTDDNERITINGIKTIKMFWLKNKLFDDDINFTVLKKKDRNIFDLNEYNIRFSSLNEEKIDKKNTEILKIVNKPSIKTFRLKNRFEIISEDKNFRYDLSIIKMGKGETIRESKVLRKNPKYEIELECLNNELVLKKKMDSLFKNLTLLLKLYQKSSFLIKNSEKNKIIKLYNDTFKTDKFITANPVSLQIDNIKDNENNILTNYAVTYKADGLKRLMIINKEGEIYFLDSSYNVYQSGIKVEKKYGLSIFESEQVKNKFMVYDVLYYKGKDVRNLYFNFPSKDTRYKLMKEFIPKIKNNIELKKYSFGDVFEKSKLLWDKKDELGYKVDGLIYLPEHLSYPNKGGAWKNLFKWKPLKYNSIDFLVRTVKDKKKDLIKPYIEKSNTVTNKIRQYKVLELFVGKYNDKVYEPVLFKPLSETGVFLNYKNKIMTTEHEEILDDTIVEFIYDKEKHFKWIPIKVRYDKTEKYKNGEPIFGNNEKVALSVWNSIINPVTEEMITTGKNIPINTNYYVSNFNKNKNKNNLREFHNKYVKNSLIKEVSPAIIENSDIKKGYLLDLACGRSGDLPKWSNGKYEKIIGIDISENCIEQSSDFYNNYVGEKPDVKYYCGDSSKLIFPDYQINKQLKKVIPSKYMFDVVSIQFCLHYFFENKKKLNALLLNITDNLKIGGFLIGTCFNGNKVYNKLKGKKFIKGKNIWKITKKYGVKSFNPGKQNFGRKISVFINSIGKEHDEFLVDLNLFTDICNKYGLELVRYEPFEDIFNKLSKFKMSNVDKEFSFLNTLFIFKKVENISPKLYTKFLKMK